MKYLRISDRIEAHCMTPATGVRKFQLLTHGETLALLADKIGGVIAHRIDFPKVIAGKMGRTASLRAKTRPLLTPEERQDVHQATALVLVATGALDRGRLTFGDWKTCFRAVRGPLCLRIDRKAKNKSRDRAD